MSISFLDRLKYSLAGFRDGFANDRAEAPHPIGWSTSSMDEAWLATIHRILEEGHDTGDRTGTGTRTIFGNSVRIPVCENTLPVLSIKKTGYKDAIAELQWMLSGSNSLVPLLKQGIHIWTDWPLATYVKETGEQISRDEFEARILGDRAFAAQWGVIDPCYGIQMRAFPTEDGPVDQMQRLVDEIKNNPRSRRLVWSLWTPHMTTVAGGTGLPPCHYAGTVNVVDKKDGRGPVISLLISARSLDSALGMPYNLAAYGYFLHVLSAITGFALGEILFFSHDTHLYLNHINPIKAILDRPVRPDPSFHWIRKPESIDDLRMDDFVVEGYDPHPFVKLPVAV